MLTEVSATRSDPTLRLYGWDPPCLSLGRHQPTDAADLWFCSQHGVDVVRRPTGGRALLHHLELTYSVVALLGRDPLPRALQDTYVLLCSALVQACKTLGIAAELTSGEVNLALPSPSSTIPCFKAPAGGEVVVAGRKLVGSAMRSHRVGVLQHGAILVDWDGELQAGSMGLEDDRSLRPHVTTLADELDTVPERSALEAVIASAFEHELGVRVVPGELSDAERRLEAELAAGFVVG